VANVYFELTEAFNAEGTIAVLASGQAVVFHRLAIMSKDGDWVLQESASACHRVLAVLERRAARYRASAPLDPRWLAGGWSSHLEFRDERGRRVRCDFVSRPPRIALDDIPALFSEACGQGPLRVIDLDRLIRLKQTQRAKDYAVIGELARRLPPASEILYTTDVDRILELSAQFPDCPRKPARAALQGGRDDVVIALAREIDELQTIDRERMGRYERASAAYFAELLRSGVCDLALSEGHTVAVDLAERLLPMEPA
jgi:hypothetical protein